MLPADNAAMIARSDPCTVSTNGPKRSFRKSTACPPRFVYLTKAKPSAVIPATASPTGDKITPIADANAEKAMLATTIVPPSAAIAKPMPPTAIAPRPTIRTSWLFSLTNFLTNETPLLTKRNMPAKSSSNSPPTAAATSTKAAFNAFIWFAKLPLVRTASPCAAVVPRMMMLSLACAFCASVAVFGSSCMLSSS